MKNREIQILQELGLTSQEAKIYQLLLKNGKQKASAISRKINADRANTYQKLYQLHKKGFLIKILGKPAFYKAVPIEDAITNILERKKKQFHKLRDHAKELLRSSPRKEMLDLLCVEEFSIAKFGKEQNLKVISDSCHSAEESTDLLLNKKLFLAGLINNYEPHIEAIKGGVKYRVITDYINLEPSCKSLQTLMAELNFQIKHVPNITELTSIVIIDKKLASIKTSPDTGIGEGSSLLITNNCCLKIIQFYFDNLWNQAQKWKP